MNRLAALLAAMSIGFLLVGQANATPSEAICRARAAQKAVKMYTSGVREIAKCSKHIALGDGCNANLRDATLQTKLASSVISLIAACKDSVATGIGFTSDSKLANVVAGTATGEGRQVVDSVYGRSAHSLSTAEIQCASSLTGQSMRAGKFMIKKLMACGSSCSPLDTAAVDAAFNTAATRITNRCSALALSNLIGGNLTTHLTAIRNGAQRVVDSLTPGANPVVSVLQPTSGSVITPPGLPASVDVSAKMGNLPHAGYVVNMQVNGADATYDELSSSFEHQIDVANPPQSNFSIFVKARTYLGIFNAATNVKFNLGNVAPDVVINSPATGIITPNSSTIVTGQVIGDLSAADVLLVGGNLTSFNSLDGTFSTSVSLGTQVNIVKAEVQSFSLGTTKSDSVVVLKGTALPLTSRVPNANYNRVNNSGFSSIGSLITGQLGAGFDPSNFIGMPINGGSICEFSHGALTSSVGAQGAHNATVSITVNNFHLKACGVDSGFGFSCDVNYDANSVNILVQADLVPGPLGDLDANVLNTTATFFGGNGSASGNILCDFANLFISVKSELETQFGGQIEEALPAALKDALAGIDIAGPLGGALNVIIDAVYDDMVEDSTGVTFIVDSNVIALNPVPDAPPITNTLLPNVVGPPVLGANIPNTSTPYDLEFCLADGFVNRIFAAFMQEGLLNQSLSEFPDPQGGSGTVPLTTPLLTLILGDPTFQIACPNCPVSLVLSPTVAGVARQPNPGEDGDVVMIIPNYRIDAVADNGGTPVPLVSATVVFELPITLGALGSTISPTIGTLNVTNFRVIDNPIGANEDTLATQLVALFPLAAQNLGSLFASIPLPPFQGIQIYGYGSGYNVSCTALYLGFSPPPPTATPTITKTPTRTRTPTITPTGTVTPTGVPPLGSHSFVLGSGSNARVKGVLDITFNLTGNLVINGGVPDGNGVAPIAIPKDTVHFDPVFPGLPGVAAVCVKAEADGNGIIDCDGGSAGYNQLQTRDHNINDTDPSCTTGTPDTNPSHAGVCNGPAVNSSSGTFASGGIRVTQDVSITLYSSSSQYGTDGQPCTNDDTPPSPPAPATIVLTTGTATGTISDANNFGGQTITSSVTGTPISCTNFRNNNLSGLTMGGAFVALDAPTIGDATTTLNLVAQ